ncbi:GAF sensor signal transduction histidine kinase [Parafrankia sp. EAN1pec]|uniref:GAF domain-containing sensor histidine kinase n=1 Tax=Parafrankia sp. (strain EAN1pec) TaxID=298653 RepID=UPI0000544144|nr:GAF sensor signal transduction histidine kinase [Frankia sp. EAN1pec]
MVQTGAGPDAPATSSAEPRTLGGAGRRLKPGPRSEVYAVQSRMRGLLDAVVDVARELSLPVTLRRIAQAARSLVDCELGALGVLGQDGAITELIAVGPGEEVPRDIARMPPGRGLIGEPGGGPHPGGNAPRVGTAVVAPETLGFPPGRPRFTTFLNVPIAVRGEAFGNLYLVGKRGPEFTQEDEDLVEALAAAVGFAIENARLYEATRRRQAWLTASAEITTALLSVAEPVDALRLVARRARQITSALLAAIVLPVNSAEAARPGRFGVRPRRPAARAGGAPRSLEVAVVDGPLAEQLRGRMLPERVGLFKIMKAGRAVLVPAERADPAAHSLLGEAVDGLVIGTVMVIPLLAAGRPLGVLMLTAAPGAVPFGQLDLEMAAAFAGQAALALELARVQWDRERLAVFEERDRIARDLHDVVIQRLFATGLQMQGLARVIDEGAAVRLNDAVRELDQTIADIRHTIFSLTASAGAVDLRAEIAGIVSQAEQALGIRPTARIDGPVDRGIPEVIHPHLLAAIREALSNIARHARATRIEVLVRVTNTDVSVQVRDDGCGPGGASRSSGLTNLRRRALDLGGRMEFGPGEDGIGTTVTWYVPLVQPIPPPRALPRAGDTPAPRLGVGPAEGPGGP